jgi:branched-chain amino acid transport system substrate-binding protein
MMLRYATATSFGAALGLLLPACAADSPSTEEVGVTATTVAVGTFGPQTGPAAAWGSIMRGMDAYMRMVNDEGGVHGRQVRFVVKDDQYQPARTVAAVRELVERDRVFAILGGIGTAPVSAVRGYLTQHGVPVVGVLSGSHQFTIPEDPLIFGGISLYAEEAAALVDHAIEALGAQRIAVAFQNDDFGRGGLLGAEMTLERHGGTLAGSTSLELMDSDLGPQALRLRQTGADAVLLVMTPRHAAILVQEAARIGFRPQWLATTPLGDAELMDQLTGGLWRGTMFAMTADVHTETEALSRFREAHRRYANDERAGAFFFAGMQLADLFIEALRRAGPQPTRAALIEALEGMEGYHSTGPPVRYDGNRRHPARAVLLGVVRPDGSVELVTDWIVGRVDWDEVARRGG